MIIGMIGCCKQISPEQIRSCKHHLKAFETSETRVLNGDTYLNLILRQCVPKVVNVEESLDKVFTECDNFIVLIEAKKLSKDSFQTYGKLQKEFKKPFIIIGYDGSVTKIK